MAISNVLVVFTLLAVATLLGFIAAWLIRQTRITQMIDLVKKKEDEVKESKSLIDQYHVDRDLLKEETDKYKSSYNTQLAKNQSLAEKMRQQQLDVDRAKMKVKELTEISLKAQNEVDMLKLELLSRPKPIRRIIKVKSNLSPVKMSNLSLLDKKKY